MPWIRIKEFINTSNIVIFYNIIGESITTALVPVKSGDIVYYRGNCTIKADSQDIPPETPTIIDNDSYLTLENGTLEYGWLKIN